MHSSERPINVKLDSGCILINEEIIKSINKDN